MAKKRTGMGTLNDIAREDEEGGITVTLPDSVRGNLALMRRLNHRVVDIIADYGFVDWLVHDVERRLAVLSTDVMCGFTTALVREARTATKQAGKAESKRGRRVTSNGTPWARSRCA